MLETGGAPIRLDQVVERLDRITRREGFHVLREWDHSAQRFIDDDIAVLMLDYFGRAHLRVGPARAGLALLLDYYLLYVLALILMRAWDEGDLDDNVERITSLLADLQGPSGSGRRFVADASALLFIAISHFEPDHLAYHRLLDQTWRLGAAQRLRLALVGGPLLGSHLRWGLAALYENRVGLMRDDNFSDYPWLFFSVACLVDEYDRLVAEEWSDERSRVAAALMGGLSPDPDAFLGEPPASLAKYTDAHAHARELLHRNRHALLADIDRLEPVQGAFSPLGFQFNFPHNVLIATVVLGLAGQRLPNLPLNALLEVPAASGAGEEMALARALTTYAAGHPARQRNRSVLMLEWEPAVALRSFTDIRDALRRIP